MTDPPDVEETLVNSGSHAQARAPIARWLDGVEMRADTTNEER
jgi:hypothetical protein